MQTERTKEQKLQRCALLKGYETKAFRLANLELGALYCDLDKKSPMQLMKDVRDMWPRYNGELEKIFAQRDKDVNDFDEECDRENLRRHEEVKRSAAEHYHQKQLSEAYAEYARQHGKAGAASIRDCTEAMRRMAEAMQQIGGTEITIPQPVGHLMCYYAKSAIAVYEPIGWFKRLMLRWCFGLRYEPEPFTVKPNRPAPTPPEKD